MNGRIFSIEYCRAAYTFISDAIDKWSIVNCLLSEPNSIGVCVDAIQIPLSRVICWNRTQYILIDFVIWLKQFPLQTTMGGQVTHRSLLVYNNGNYVPSLMLYKVRQYEINRFYSSILRNLPFSQSHQLIEYRPPFPEAMAN